MSGKLGREAALDAVRSGISHFVSESNIDYSQPEDEVDQLGPDAWVTINVSCNDEVWHASTGLGSEIVEGAGTMSKTFVIEAIGFRQPQLYWSNDWGWGDRNGATVFREEELDQLDLPIGGRWWSRIHQLAEMEKLR